MNELVSLLLLTWAGAAFAAAPPEPSHWSVACQTGAGQFTIRFDSLTNDVTDDDMKVTVDSPQGALAVPVKPAWYHKRGGITQLPSKSVCDGIPAYEIGNGSILVFLSRDQRPGFDVLTLFLYDPSRNAIVDRLEEVGALKSADQYTSFLVLKTRDGFRTRLVKESIGHTGHDSAETEIEGWKYIHLKDDKLAASWTARPNS